jgi:hypothetical protein
MRCKNETTYDVTWKFINSAWVSAITVCLQNLDPQAPENINKIYVFTNSDYVDWVSDVGVESEHEANNVISTLRSQGFTVNTFTNIDFSSATNLAGSRGVIIIPELESADLAPDLTDDAKTRLSTWVSRGGSLIMFDPEEESGIEVLNDTFSFSLASTGVDDPLTLTEAGSAIPTFASASSEIPSQNATGSLVTDTLPEDSVTIYSGAGVNESVVTLIRYGSGYIFILGWDWYDAAPT